ncbi:Predicted arabinose efflux permease, MFS family [Amycolatopsis sacchari]|uniref:Predicted arabinose efflux permease, MFS family n=1 Tax=Amycolatopsis sacchari TaxID=115433 RepID=A0A1I3JDZ9_9PSEU|nr:MFS transporter [Amycolatopsis sacchari]SFI58376.1 Predicted arabinose efflux permease, MFS family [Amycolatopsis sacchari]
MRRAALYVGGLLGPFGAGVVSSMLPELARTFDVSQSSAATSLTAYLLPFALVMLVSGTLGERWGPMRTIRVAYAGYVVVALLAALAPWFWLFQVSRGLQGVANAFTTPLLLTKLASVTPKERLGRTLGLYGAVQSIGQTSAPLIGGLAAESSWRWAFVGIAAVAAVLTASPLPPDERAAEQAPRLRDAWRPVVVWSGVVIFVAWACLAGLPFLVAFRVDDAFALGPGARGLVLTAFGLAGIVTARLVGSVADRFGPRLAVCAGLLLGAVAVASIGLVAALPLVVLAWAVGGLCGQLVLVGVNALVLGGEANGRGGAISVVTALRFLGMSASPAAFTDLYRHSAVWGFLLPGVLLAATAPLLAHRIFRSGTGPRARLRHSRG